MKLLDFGVATFKDALQATKSGTVKGKPAYLAPEQLEGKPIDGRVDVFALGIVMHEMLTLQHLFAGDSDLGTVKQIMEMDIPSPAANRTDVPDALERTVMRALERDREKRFTTAAEMAAALDDFVVASKLHVDDVVTFVRAVAEAAPPLPVLVAAGGDATWAARPRATVRSRRRPATPPRRRVAAAPSSARRDFADARGRGDRRDAGGAGRGDRVRSACDGGGQSRRAQAGRRGSGDGRSAAMNPRTRQKIAAPSRVSLIARATRR